MPDRRAFSVATAASIFSLGDSRARVPSAKKWRLGSLSGSRDSSSPLWRAFTEELARRGLVEGKAFTWFGQSLTELKQLDGVANDLVRANVDIIVTDLREGVTAAKQATKTIPIVMLVWSDAVLEGWVTSFAHPGGNVTGMSSFPSEMERKRLQILIEALGRPTRIAYLVFAPFRRRPHVIAQIKLLDDLATSKGVQLSIFEVEEEHGSLRTALEQAAQAAAQGVLIQNHATIGAQSYAEVGDLALSVRLPSITGFREYASGGVLFTYSEDGTDIFRKGATYVARIMAGAKAAELPIEFPTRYEFVINLKTAATLGLQIPRALLLRADELIR